MDSKNDKQKKNPPLLHDTPSNFERRHLPAMIMHVRLSRPRRQLYRAARPAGEDETLFCENRIPHPINRSLTLFPPKSVIGMSRIHGESF